MKKNILQLCLVLALGVLILVASVSMILEGVHLKSTEGILCYRNTKSYNLFMQLLGRLCTMNQKAKPVFVDIYKSYLNISLPVVLNTIDGEVYDIKVNKNKSKLHDRINRYIHVYSSTYELIELSKILEKQSKPVYLCKGYEFTSDSDLSIQLEKNVNYVGKLRAKGLSYEEIIDKANTPKKLKSCKGYEFSSDIDLSRQLEMYDCYVSRFRRKGLSYEEIIDKAHASKKKSCKRPPLATLT